MHQPVSTRLRLAPASPKAAPAQRPARGCEPREARVRRPKDIQRTRPEESRVPDPRDVAGHLQPLATAPAGASRSNGVTAGSFPRAPPHCGPALPSLPPPAPRAALGEAELPGVRQGSQRAAPHHVGGPTAPSCLWPCELMSPTHLGSRVYVPDTTGPPIASPSAASAPGVDVGAVAASHNGAGEACFPLFSPLEEFL